MLRRPPTSTRFPYTTLFRSTYKTQSAAPDELAVELVSASKELKPGVKTGQTVADAVALTRDLINQPAAVAHPRYLLEQAQDRKSTRLNSSHVEISYAVFCLK